MGLEVLVLETSAAVGGGGEEEEGQILPLADMTVPTAAAEAKDRQAGGQPGSLSLLRSGRAPPSSSASAGPPRASVNLSLPLSLVCLSLQRSVGVCGSGPRPALGCP